MAENLATRVVEKFQMRFQSEGDLTRQAMEIQAGELLDKLGLIERSGMLTGVNAEIVAAGIADLWKIKLSGGRMEANDSSIVGQVKLEDKPENPNMEAIVAGQLQKVHQVGDWFDNSVTALVNAGLATDSANQNSLKDWVMIGPDKYIHSLEDAGIEYSSLEQKIGLADEGAKVVNYLDSVRPANLSEMKGLLHRGLGTDLSALTVVNSSNQ